jgi:hypothetical protein
VFRIRMGGGSPTGVARVAELTPAVWLDDGSMILATAQGKREDSSRPHANAGRGRIAGCCDFTWTRRRAAHGPGGTARWTADRVHGGRLWQTSGGRGGSRTAPATPRAAIRD